MKNRFGHVIETGMQVGAAHSRGGQIFGIVTKVSREPSYGWRATIDHGHSVALDDCAPIEFRAGIDIRCREPSSPAIARFYVNSWECKYCVIGTQYGYLHTSGGDVRTWKTASGARRAIAQYVPL